MRPLVASVLAAVGLPTLLLALALFAPRTLVRPVAALHESCAYQGESEGAPPTPARTSVSGDAGRDSLVALTLDDAPDPETTPMLLDSLRAHGARATFFVITGQLGPDSSTVLQRIRREGHEIGNHFTADRPSIRLDSAAFETDLRKSDSALGPFGPVVWARPGAGWTSPRMGRAMRRAGYRCALGSVYPLDAAHRSTAFSSWYILTNVYPGAVIVLHDRGERGRRTAMVLGRVLPELRRRGYRVVTLSELVEAGR
jgi:peptidoglycan/xylan/chitin deacetylase (PgdA/CDA1 family)